MTALLSIGELASRTGLPVRTIRFYSDAGVVPPAERTDAGYRLYGPDALARLGLVRTLRDLGIDLATIRRVLEREVSVADVAAAHAAAIDAQIRVLRVQKAVLGAVARRGSDPQEMQTHAPARPTVRRRAQADRRRLPRRGLRRPRHRARLRRRGCARPRPSCPTTPRPSRSTPGSSSPSSSRTTDFQASIRRMSEQHAADARGRRVDAAERDWQAAAALVAERGRPRRASTRRRPRRARSSTRSSPRSRPRRGSGRSGVARALADRLATGTDARAERYWQLLAIINGWPPVPTTVPAWEWLIAALR